MRYVLVVISMLVFFIFPSIYTALLWVGMFFTTELVEDILEVRNATDYSFKLSESELNQLELDAFDRELGLEVPESPIEKRIRLAQTRRVSRGTTSSGPR